MLEVKPNDQHEQHDGYLNGLSPKKRTKGKNRVRMTASSIIEYVGPEDRVWPDLREGPSHRRKSYDLMHAIGKRRGTVTEYEAAGGSRAELRWAEDRGKNGAEPGKPTINVIRVVDEEDSEETGHYYSAPPEPAEAPEDDGDVIGSLLSNVRRAARASGCKPGTVKVHIEFVI